MHGRARVAALLTLSLALLSHALASRSAVEVGYEGVDLLQSWEHGAVEPAGGRGAARSQAEPRGRRTLQLQLAVSAVASQAEAASANLVQVVRTRSFVHLREGAVGVACALGSQLLSSIGMLLQRLAHLEREKRDTRLVYALGVVFYIAAAPLDVLSYALAPLIICGTIGCFRLVLLSILARLVLKEPLGAAAALGVVVCSLGTLLCLLSSPGREVRQAALHEVVRSREYTYVAVGTSCLLGLVAFDYAAERHVPSTTRTQDTRFLLPFMCAFAYALEKVLNSELGLVQRESWHDAQWLTLAALVGVFAILNLYLNLRGVRLLPVSTFVPLVFGFTSLLVLFQSVFVLGEFWNSEPQELATALAGAVMALAGALCVQQQTPLETKQWDTETPAWADVAQPLTPAKIEEHAEQEPDPALQPPADAKSAGVHTV